MEKIKSQLGKTSRLKKWVPLMVLASALTIIIIDTTVLNVSIRNMVDDLDTNVQGIQWVISSYSLVLAALTVTGGRLGDLFGRKKMFKIGAVLFAVGSLITSFAPNIGWVIFGNAIIEGIGAALMMPATAALLINHYHGRDRALAFAIWGAMAAVSSSIGPVLGGWLTTDFSWRWAFRINLFVVIALLIGARFIKEAKEHSAKKELDMVGVLLSSLGLTSIVYGLIESSGYGWFMAKKPFELMGAGLPLGLSVTPVALVLGLVLLVLFVRHEHRRELAGKTPLVSLGLFKNKQFTSGALTTAALALGQTGLLFAVPIFYQSVLGLDALHTGLGMVPMSLAIMIGAPLGLRLTRRFTPKQVIQLGFLISVAGIAVMRFSLGVDSSPMDLAPGLMIYGLGTGFGFSQLGNLTLSAVSGEQAGEASGVNNTLRQIGASFGSAVIGAVLIATLTSNVVAKVSRNQDIPDDIKPQLVEKVAEAGSNIEFGGSGQISGLEPRVEEQLTKNIHEATAEANRIALTMTGGFVLLALLVSSMLPNIRNLETEKPAHERPASAH